MKVLIIDNGFKAHKPFLIKSFEKDINIELKVIYNFESLKKFSLIERIFYRLRFPLDNSNFNSRILSISNKFKPHLILIIKGNYVLTRTMEKLKSNSNAKIVSWSADNMIKKHNTSFYFDRSISKYDIHFTTKSTAVETLKNIGARKVVFLNKAFSKYDHFPADYDIKYDFDVLFIGTAERERFKTMKYLSENGIKVNIFGNLWSNKYQGNNNLKIHRRPLMGEEYRKAIYSSKITLCFLRKINDDLQTDRTMEIPACKGLMFAERTHEHESLFKENQEAIFFNSNEDLLKKIKFYLANYDLAINIRNNGYSRCIKSNYDFDSMKNIILSEIKK